MRNEGTRQSWRLLESIANTGEEAKLRIDKLIAEHSEVHERCRQINDVQAMNDLPYPRSKFMCERLKRFKILTIRMCMRVC